MGRWSFSEVGYLINNATYVRAAYVIGLAGGQVTGHGYVIFGSSREEIMAAHDKEALGYSTGPLV